MKKRPSKMKRMFRFALMAFLAGATQVVFGQEPVNKNASPEARNLLSYLYSLRNKRILSGQHCFNEDPNTFYDRVHDITGKYPALWGTDFIWNGDEDPGNRVVEEAIRRYKDEGVFVTLMWHAGKPTDDPPYGWRESIQGELTDEEWKELTTPGSELHKRWEAQVDQIATYLKDLKDASVPVLWRPYHEMNGVWFWWGDKKGEEGYVKLWKMMFDRFVNVHELDNLIWVWNANAPRNIPKDEAYEYQDFYPGHEYVDILATDVYNFDYEQDDYESLVALASGKPIALGEVGELPNTVILEAQPEWTWFMVWSRWLDTHSSPERVRNVYQWPLTLTRDEVTYFKK